MGKLDVKAQNQGEKGSLMMSGAMDEDAKLPDPGTLSALSEVIIDTAGIQAINSCGVREWIKWVKAMPPTLKLVYVNSPKIIVDQMNMIGGLLPKGSSVKSFFVPYFCESDKLSHNVLFTEGKEFTGKTAQAPATMACPKCGKPMEIDVIEAKYFKFLAAIS